MKSFDLIKRINEEIKKSDEDLSKTLSALDKENTKDAQVIKIEIYKHLANRRYDTITDLLDVISDLTKDEDSIKEEHKNIFFRFGKK